METKKELRQTAELLAEKYEDINDKQKEFARRAEKVLRLVNYKEPLMTAVERAEAEELRKMSMNIRDMQIRLEQLKKKSAQIAQTDVIESNGNKEIVFTRNQEEAIRLSLSQMYVCLHNLKHFWCVLYKFIQNIRCVTSYRIHISFP